MHLCPAPNTVKKCASSFSAWQKWAEARDINVLPTSGPELACYFVHLLQNTKSLASIQAAAFGVAWAHQKACFLLPLRHIKLKQLLEACRSILSSCPKNRKTPLTAGQVKGLVLQFGGGNPGELQTVCLIDLGFTAFLRWGDLKDLRCHDLHMSSEHMSIMLTKMKKMTNSERVLSSWWLSQVLMHALYPWPKDLYLLVNIRNLTIFLGRFTKTSMVSPFIPDSWLTLGPPSCLRSNSKSLGSTPNNMAYTVSVSGFSLVLSRF